MSKKSFIDSIEVKTPCSEDWNEMTGTDKTRFCGHCSKSVNNISALTRKQAMRIVRDAKGEICVRYIKNPKTNAPVFAGKLYQISRRAGIAAGVLGASLSLSTLTYAQGSPGLIKRERMPQIEVSQEKQSKENKTENATASVSGTVSDPNGAVIPNATITLSGENFFQTASSNENGFYEFKNLSVGKYSIDVDAAGFSTASYRNVSAVENSVNRLDIEMRVSAVTETITVGEAAFVEYTNPLSLAVSEEDIEEVRKLIAEGASVNGKDENYNNVTPLFLAVENGNVEMVETLLNFGAKVNARDKNKQTPLTRLDEDASPQLVRALITHGAKINLIDDEGNTALILAARSANAEVLQILIDHGADVNIQNKQGQTALMNAADGGNLESVRALLLAGAKVNLKNKEGETAWDLTTESAVEELLENHGAIVKDN